MAVMTASDREIDRRAGLIGALLRGDALRQCDGELLRWAIKRTLGAMAYYRFHDDLPAEVAGECRRQYMFGAVQDMKYASAYAEVCGVLKEVGIDFLPMKGMALVLQGVYPNGALRLHCDIDLLMRSEADCRRAAEALKAAGWRGPGEFDSYHHVPPLHKREIMLEIHHLIPGVRDEELNRRFWEKDFIRQGDGREYRLSDELHFAVLFAHTAINHDWEFGERFLLDAGMLMRRSGFDVEKSFAYCRMMGIAAPEHLLSAFPEIFGGGQGVPEPFSLLRRHVLGGTIPFASLVMTEPGRFGWSWWRKRLGGFRLKWLRQKYGAADADWQTMLGLVWRDYCNKFVTGWKFAFKPSVAEMRKRNSAAAREALGITAPNEELNHL